MTADIFLAVIVFCAAGAGPSNEGCESVKFEPPAGMTETSCLARLDALAQAMLAERARDGVHLTVWGRRCYPLANLQDVPAGLAP